MRFSDIEIEGWIWEEVTNGDWIDMLKRNLPPTQWKTATSKYNAQAKCIHARQWIPGLTWNDVANLLYRGDLFLQSVSTEARLKMILCWPKAKLEGVMALERLR